MNPFFRLLKSPVMLMLGVSLGLTGCVHYRSAPLDPSATADLFEARSLDDARFQAFLRTNSVSPPSSWDLETLTLAALYWHPKLDVARAEWASARAAELTGAARPNPTIGAGPEYNFNPASGVTPWIANLNLDWPIETAGKRGKRIAHAQARSMAWRLRLGVVAWEVRSELRLALLEYATAQERERLLRSQVAAQEKIVERLEAKIRAGAANRLDAAPARISLARARGEAAAARSLAAASVARIGAAVGVPMTALTPAVIQFSLELPAPDRIEQAQARRAALMGRADVLAGLAEYAAAEAALRLEVARQYPDIHLGTGYQYDQGENKWSIGISSELPLFNRNQGPIREAVATRTEAAARFVAVQASVIAQVDRAMARWNAAQEQLSALRSLQAALEQQLQSTIAQANLGAVEPLELLLVQAELVNGELATFDGRVRVAEALGELEDALQLPFKGLERLEQEPGRGSPAMVKGTSP